MKAPVLAVGLALVLTACQWPVADQFNNPEDRKAPSSVTYTLTMMPTLGGTITPTGALVVNKGKATSILAQANEGYSFVNWTVPTGTDVAFGNASDSATTVALNLGNATVKANFGPIIVTTVAGNGTSGYNGDNILATTAQLGGPYGTAIDPSGNLYIADLNNSRVRKVLASTKIISTVAGMGTRITSGDGSDATAAGIEGPWDIAFDSQGNLYIDDFYAHRIRKVDSTSGKISTVVGTGSGGYTGDGDLATLATIGGPTGIAFDSSGNYYITDSSNGRIRKVAIATGIISTVAGNGTTGAAGDGGPATAAALLNPYGLTIDRWDNLYFIDTGRLTVRKVSLTTGIITTVAGNGSPSFSGDGGAATAAGLRDPYDVAVDAVGNLYIDGYDGSRIRKVNAKTGIITTIAGDGVAAYNGDGGAAVSAQFWNPTGVTLDSFGNLYIADKQNQRIRKIPGAGGGIGP